MRIALIADTHGNAVALETVAAELARERLDAVVCLGDVAQGGPEPARTLELIRALGARVVLGNSDAFLLDPASAEGSREAITPRHLEMREWTLSRLSPEDIAYHESFEPTAELDLGGGRSFVGCHATPSSYDPWVLPHIPEEEFRRLLEGCDADVIAGGHMHMQFVRRRGSSLFVNPGSVGLSYDHEQPEDDFRVDPWAAWAVLDVDGPRLSLELRRTPLDVAAVVDALLASGMPGADVWARRWQPRVSA